MRLAQIEAIYAIGVASGLIVARITRRQPDHQCPDCAAGPDHGAPASPSRRGRPGRPGRT